MGSDDGEENEKPPHAVSVTAFEMGRTEVTVGQYRACIEAGKCRDQRTVDWAGVTDDERRIFSATCNLGLTGRDEHPVNCVDWDDATAYCEFAGGRLPTEEEWEYAARGRESRRYTWGRAEPGPQVANACGAECDRWATANGFQWKAMYSADDGWPTTAPVARFAAGRGPFGLDDMAGNVWEWTSGRYCPDGDEACSEAARVLRGGGWFDNVASWLRAAFRGRYTPSLRNSFLGFRCAR